MDKSTSSEKVQLLEELLWYLPWSRWSQLKEAIFCHSFGPSWTLSIHFFTSSLLHFFTSFTRFLFHFFSSLYSSIFYILLSLLLFFSLKSQRRQDLRAFEREVAVLMRCRFFSTGFFCAVSLQQNLFVFFLGQITPTWCASWGFHRSRGAMLSVSRGETRWWWLIFKLRDVERLTSASPHAHHHKHSSHSSHRQNTWGIS